MKDLKHLYYFEKLLEDANNELVRKAQGEGRKCVATVCENVPEPLLNLPGTFFRAASCTAHGLDGDGDVLSDQLFCVSIPERS